jgi:aminopeptidase N
LGSNGEDLPLDLEGTGVLNTPLIELDDSAKTFRFRNVPRKPVLSLNRGFSAPIRLKSSAESDDWLFLMKNDRDAFNRWEAAQTAGGALIRSTMAAIQSGGGWPRAGAFIEALGAVIEDTALDPEFRALMLQLPSEAEIATGIGKDIDPDLVHKARERLRRDIGRSLMPALEKIWKETASSAAYSADPKSTGRRSLRYAVLQAIAGGDAEKGAALAMRAFASPPSMTDEIGALSTLLLVDRPERESALDSFRERHKDDHLLVDKWFALQASIPRARTAQRVRELTRHADFNLSTPNRVRGLLGTFSMGNFVGFNSPDGEGFAVLADTIISLDPRNPQVAARLATAFRSWRMLESGRRALAEAALNRILAATDLSRDTFEIVTKSISASE